MEILVNTLRDKSINLHTLSLQHCGLDDEDVRNLMPVLPPSLTHLNLSKNRIGNAGALAIANALNVNLRNPDTILNLKVLTLNNTEIEDEGMVAIAKAVVNAETVLNAGTALNNNGVVNEEITTLECKDNKLTIEGAKALIDILKSKEQFAFTVAVNFDGVVNQAREADEQITSATAQAANTVANAWYNPGIHQADFQIATLKVYEATERRLHKGITTNSSENQFYHEYRNYKDKLDKKIEFLTQKYPGNKEIKAFASALQTRSKAIDKDIEEQLDTATREHDLGFDEAKKISNSSAMVILRATDNMLEKVLKEGQTSPELVVTALNDYSKNCQSAIQEKPFWHQLVGGVIFGVLMCMSAFCPAFALPAFYIEAAEFDPFRALYLITRDLRKASSAGFTPDKTSESSTDDEPGKGSGPPTPS